MFRVQQPLANLAMAKTCLFYAIFASHEAFGLSSGFGSHLEAPFLRSAKDEWPRYFSNAKRDSQLMELATSYLTQQKGYTLDGDINAAMYFAIKHHLHDIETWLVDHHRPSIDPNVALLAKCMVDEIHSLDFVGFWIEQGADVNAPFVIIPTMGSRYIGFNPEGSTPLHMAASWSRVALAQLLLQNGASLKAENNDGLTPLQVAFQQSFLLAPNLIELLWFDGGQSCFDSSGNNLLHNVVQAGRQQRGQMDGLGNNKVLMEETVAWLINHGVDPLSKNANGETPLHKAARHDHSIAIKALYAATGSSSEYEGCLLAFLHNVRSGNWTLSTAQLLFEIDTDPLGEFKYGSGLLPFLLSKALVSANPVDRENTAFDSEFSALILKHEEDPASKLDIYMSFLEFILKDCCTDVSAIMRWLAMEVVKSKGPEFLGVQIWSATLILLSHRLVDELSACVIEIVFRQIQELFDRREILGVGIKELYRLLLWTALDGGPLAKLIISQELPYAGLGLSDETQRLPRVYDDQEEPHHWFKMTIISLMIHREIHPDTKNEDDDALLYAVIRIPLDLPHLAMTRLLIERLLRKRARDINYQVREGLTLLAGIVAYLPSPWREWDSEEPEVLKSFLDAGCDADIQDNAGRTPLMTAAYRGVAKFVEILLNARCNANLQDREGGTSLTEIVTNHGISDRKTQEVWKQRFSPVGGYTALMYAVIVGRVRIVELLLKYNCDTKLINNQGRTALDLARQFDESRIVKILERHEDSEQSN